MLDTQWKFPSAQEMIKMSGPEIKRLEDKLLKLFEVFMVHRA